MLLSTEVFVMAIFLAGLPFFHAILRDSGMQGGNLFMLAYISLVLSNIFTVVEEFWFNYLFNVCEHLFIVIGSVVMLAAILKLTTGRSPKGAPGASHEVKG